MLATDARPAVAPAMKAADAATVARVTSALDRTPLSFEANRGQTDKRVRFLSRGRGYTLFLTGNEAVLSLLAKAGRPNKGPLSSPLLRKKTTGTARRAVLGVRLEGASQNPAVIGLDELDGKVNYLVGADSRRWYSRIPTYAGVKYLGVYPGIDLIYHGSTAHELEYDFVLGTGADAGEIELAFVGAQGLRLSPRGDLIVKLAGAEVIERAPVIYQQIGAQRRQISGGYIFKGKNRVGFRVAKYDRHKPLIIDPQLAYSTYLGGSGDDFAYGVAVDSSGNAYVAGATASSDFPATVNAFQSTFAGTADAFVAKLNAGGSGLVYGTYLGGSGDDGGYAIAVDSSGNAYVTGATASADFPVTAGAYQASSAGGYDAFVAKLNASGSALVYSTYLGGTNSDFGYGMAVDSAGNAYVSGFTYSGNFPATAGAYQTTFGGASDAFVTKLNAAGSALVYSTYLGGSDYDFGYGVAVDSSGNAYLTGSTYSNNFPTSGGAYQTTSGGGCDAFVTKLNATGSSLVYSTYLGSSGDDFGYAVAADSSGNAYVTGVTASSGFPTTPGAYQTASAGGLDAFVTKLSAGGDALVYSTLLSGNGDDFGYAVAVDASGSAYVTGATASSDFPTTADAYQTASGGGADVFLTKLDASGSTLAYSTYLGGTDDDLGFGVAADASGNVYVSGFTFSTDFPTTAGAYQSTSGGGADAFVARVAFQIPFASLNAKLAITLSTGSFDLLSTFTPGSGGSVNPATQSMTLQIGSYSLNPPAGCWTLQKKGWYTFAGVVGGVMVDLRLTPLSGGSYQLQAEGSGANLSGITNPVTVVLTIGNMSGAVQVNAQIT